MHNVASISHMRPTSGISYEKNRERGRERERRRDYVQTSLRGTAMEHASCHALLPTGVVYARARAYAIYGVRYILFDNSAVIKNQGGQSSARMRPCKGTNMKQTRRYIKWLKRLLTDLRSTSVRLLLVFIPVN